MKTLEEFLIEQCGMITPGLLELFEPHREFIERYLKNGYDSDIWLFLPRPSKEDYRP